MKIMFAGGGTGGHIAPGIALAEAILRLDPDLGLCFAVTGRKAEDYFFKGTGFRREIIDAPKSGSSLFSKGLAYLRLYTGARARCRKMLAKIRPDVVIGLGGYASVPVVMAAHAMKIPVYLLEQNALPGRATRFLAKKAREIFCQFDYTVRQLKGRAKTCVIGTPVRSDVLDSDHHAAAMTLKFDPNVRTILITGGSQGARGVNDLTISLLPRLQRDYGLLQIIHQTGDEDYERVAAVYAESRIESRVMRFVNPMSAALHAADIVIARAGATGIAEITALGLPSILVPYPHSLDGEQRKNALQLVDNKAAYVVEENAPNAKEEIYRAISALLDDADRAREIGANAAKMGFPCAADDIAAIIFHSLGKEKAKKSAESPDEKPERKPVGVA